MKQSCPSSVGCCPREASPRGFTLTEVLIVIGIIVLILALAVPALNVMTGSRSIDGAENNISAMLGRARSDAIAMQRDTGVLFFLDPATQQVNMAEVFATDRGGVSVAYEAVLDLVPDRDFIALPKGVYAQMIDDAVLSGTTRMDDQYLGFNNRDDAVAASENNARHTLSRFGGVILFDGMGKLVSRSYAFRSEQPAIGTATPPSTLLFNLLYTGKIAPQAGDPVPPSENFLPANNLGTATVPQYVKSAIGLILFDRDEFMSNWDLDDPQSTGVDYDASERAEEAWIDQNGTPLMVNRYNGTLVRGE